MRNNAGLISIACLTVCVSALCGAEPAGPQHLRCEFLENPLGMDVMAPRLSWWLTDARRGAGQSAYRILVASDPGILAADRGDIWDSGKVSSRQSHLVPYAGPALQAFQDCHWKVQIWDQDGQPSPWSAPARWSLGPLSTQDWEPARWIRLAEDVKAPPTPSKNSQVLSNEAENLDSHLPIFRRELIIAKPLKRAMFHLCGMGHHEILLDGAPITERLLDPPWTQYDKTCGFITYDLTARLAPGPHALGIMLGNGFFHIPGGRYTKIRRSSGQPQLIGLVRLEYADGSVAVIGSDAQWRCQRGPVVFSCVYGGEDHDLRREPVGWAKPGFDAGTWQQATLSQGPGGRLRWIPQEPVLATERFQPKTMTAAPKGVRIDFGQNCALMPVLRLQGPAGARIRIHTGEGASAGPGPSGGFAGLRYQCTLAGRGAEVFRPRFVSWGSRSLFIEGASLADNQGSVRVRETLDFVPVREELDPADAVDESASPADGQGPVRILGAEGWALRCGAEAVGGFTTSDPTINAIDCIITWAVHSNFQHVLTDCPHREKLGWLEVSHLMAPSILARFGAAAFYRKIQNDMADVQQVDGMVPTVAPYAPFGRGAFGDSPEWGSAFIINPGLSWQWTGDRSNLDQHYPAMCRYVEYLTRRAKDGILAYGLGDWMPIEKTPMPIVATATLYHDLDLMARYARILGKNDEAIRFQEQAAGVVEAFDQAFWKSGTLGYGEGSQCAQAMPLFFGLAKPERRAAATARLIADARTKKRATGGDVGNRYILLALAEAGEHELVLNSTVSGSGAYIPQAQQALTGGRTTLAEGWGGGNSQNHCMIGHVQEWLFGHLADIRPDPDQPGLAQVLIEPRPVGTVTWVKAHHDGPYGRIAIHWRRQAGVLEVDCTIPPNSSARLRLPTSDPTSIKESEAAPAVALQAAPVNGGVQFRLPAGSYRFRCAVPAVGQPQVQATP